MAPYPPINVYFGPDVGILTIPGQYETPHKFFSHLSEVPLSEWVERLGRVRRFSGAGPLTVLQHSVFMARMAPVEDPLLRMSCLLHDFSEAFLGDTPYPLRRVTPALDYYHALVQEGAERAFSGMTEALPDCGALDRFSASVEAQRGGLVGLTGTDVAGGQMSPARQTTESNEIWSSLWVHDIFYPLYYATRRTLSTLHTHPTPRG